MSTVFAILARLVLILLGYVAASPAAAAFIHALYFSWAIRILSANAENTPAKR